MPQITMRKIIPPILIVSLALIALMSVVSAAGADMPPIDELEDEKKKFLELFGEIKETVPLRPVDKANLELARKWANPVQGAVPPPTQTPNGAIAIMYGTHTPRVLCRPLRVTDVQLEPGEKVVSPPFIGDSLNWQIYPAISGSGGATTCHVMIKPIMHDLATNLVIHTDRRTYIMDLVSHKTNWTPFISFTYPDSGTGEWADFIKRHNAAGEANARAGSGAGLNIDNLNFDYTAKANKKNIEWQPLRVWDDGLKTYIEFPQRINSIEAPVVMLMNGKKQEIVNYRKVGNHYILDKLIKKAVLTLGSGKQAERVVIIRNG